MRAIITMVKKNSYIRSCYTFSKHQWKKYHILRVTTTTCSSQSTACRI